MVNVTCNCLGYNVFADTLENLPENTKMVINTINQYSYCMAEQDDAFKDALQNSDILLPDGVGIVAAAKFLTNSTIKKISGTELHEHLLRRLNERGDVLFYLGSSKTTLAKIEERLKREYPNINAYFYAPPFKKEFTWAENQELINKVNEVNPDVLFIGMTAPKQEKWAIMHKSQLNARYICSIGAVFDFYAGTVKRPHKFWIDLGLEWFGRMVSEPKRLYKRYLIYGPVFAYKLAREKLMANSFSSKKSERVVPIINIHPAIIDENIYHHPTAS